MPKTTTPHGSKNLIIVIVLIVAAAAGFGYFTQSEELREADAKAIETAAAKPAPKPLPAATHAIFTARAGEIVIGQEAAPLTIVEYASLSCPHCADFHQKVLPQLKKEYIDTGKVKLVFRHFPLNEPALRGAQVVECAGGAQRIALLKTLFETQKQWAFEAKFFDNLRQIAGVGGIDGARFDGCMTDKSIENRILSVRMEAAQLLHVEHTPSIFVHGKKIEGEATFEAVREAIGK